MEKYAHVREVMVSQIEVRRSSRRRRTVSAYWQGATIVVAIPARYTKAEEAKAVDEMVRRLESNVRRRKPSDAQLTKLADVLGRQYLNGEAAAESITWNSRMNSQWGSCTMEDRSIRLSSRLQQMPRYVQEYVLLHELAHLLVAEHSPAFWALVDRYPDAERAKGYLEGWSEAKDLPEISDI